MPIDLVGHVALPPIALPYGAEALALSPDGRFIYAAHSLDDKVSVIDTRTRTVVATVDVGDFPRDLTVTPDGATVYVINGGSRNISIIDAIVPSTGVPSWRVTRPPLALRGYTLGAGPLMIVPAASGTPFEIGGDTDSTARGFGTRLVSFNGGTLRLTGPLSPAGRLQVEAGTLGINGSYLAPVAVGTGATVGGNGAIGSVVVTSGAAISPGLDHVGRLDVGDLLLGPNSIFVVDVGPDRAHDSLIVDGAGLIDRARLSVRVGPELPRVNDDLWVLYFVLGTFAGQPPGSMLTTADAQFRVDYVPVVNSTTRVVSLHVLNVRPTISALADRTIDRNTVLGPLPFTIDDSSTTAASLNVTATSSNPSLVAPGNLVLLGTGATRTLTVTPRADQSGTTTISVTVSDGVLSVTEQFTLTVLAPPPPPPSPPSPPSPPLPLTYYLAEGATGAFFDTFILIANPHATETAITLTFFTEARAPIVQQRTLAPMSRTTIRIDDIAGLEAVAAVSTLVTSPDDKPIVVERTMRWDASGYGAHTEKATAGAARQWFFAEGSQGFFATFILLQNPQAAANRARITYFREGLSPVEREYALAPASRLTVDAGADAALAGTSFGARVDFDAPGVAERAMYFGAEPIFSGGHGAIGVTAPTTRWFFAEGATGSFFSTYILIANPNDADAAVTLTYLPASSAPIVKRVTIGGGRRHTITLADEDPSLADAAVAIQVEADRPIVAERAQYWPNPTWYEAHDSFGVIDTAMRWGLAEGRVGGPDAAQTYILLANPGRQDATVTLTFLRETGAPLVKQVTVPAERRFNVAVTGPGSVVPELVDEAFGTVIDSTQPLVVERSLYTNANGVTWAAGTNATATRLP